MKGCGSSVTPVLAGVRTDFESLLTKFVDEKTVRFDAFAKCFRDMKLSLIYCGRTTEAEFKEFAEKSLVLSLAFCFEPYSFQCRFGGLYLTYSLYYTQPAKYHSKIRITVEQWIQLLVFIETLKEQQHYDACYIFYKMVRDGAFHICAFSDEHNPLNYRRFDNRHDTERVVDILRAERPAIESLTEGPLIEQLSLLHENYYKLKCMLAGPDAAEPPSTLSLVVENPVDMIKTMVRDCCAKMDNPSTAGAPTQRRRKKRGEKESGTSSTPNRRSEIKQRAYAALPGATRTRRHRKAVGERSSADEDPAPSNADDSELESPPGSMPPPPIPPPARRRRTTSSTTTASVKTTRTTSPRKSSQATTPGRLSGRPRRKKAGPPSKEGANQPAKEVHRDDPEDTADELADVTRRVSARLAANLGSGSASEGEQLRVGDETGEDAASPSKTTTESLDADVSQIEASVKGIVDEMNARSSHRRRRRSSSGATSSGPSPARKRAPRKPARRKRTSGATPTRASTAAAALDSVEEAGEVEL